MNEGTEARAANDEAGAIATLEECRELFQAVGDVRGAEEAERLLAVKAHDEHGPEHVMALLDGSIDRMRRSGDLKGEADALLQAEVYLRSQRRPAESLAYTRRALEAARRSGIGGLLLLALMRSSMVFVWSGDIEEARAYVTESVAMAERFGNDLRLGWALWTAGLLARLDGDPATARAHIDRAVALSVAITEHRLLPVQLAIYGRAARDMGDTSAARAAFTEAISRASDEGELAAELRFDLARVAYIEGEWAEAELLLVEATAAATREGWDDVISWALDSRAAFESARGNHVVAAELLGAADGLRSEKNIVLDRQFALDVTRDTTAIRDVLGTARFERAFAEGRASGPTKYLDPATPSGVAAMLRPEGDSFVIAFGGEPFRIRTSKGLRYLHTLLGQPGRELSALELTLPTPGRPPAHEELEMGNVDSGPVIDSQTRAAYRQRLTDLQDELEEAESWNESERASRARGEMDAIAGELAAGLGLGGRARRLGSHAERARVNATRAIRSTIERLAEQEPTLGSYLGRRIRTGTFCSYSPDAAEPVEWTL